VWERDGGQCGFVGDSGQRCPERSRLEYDHADPVARGGEATAENVRLRCRAHNEYEAECVFGAGFMSDKRAEARARAEARRRAKVRAVDEGTRTGAAAEEAQTRAAAPVAKGATAPAPEPSTEPADERDVTPYLRKLGCNARDARRVAALCANLPNASLEERVRFALKHLMPPHRRIAAPAETAMASTT
jgi:hypothetical protein